MAQRLTLAPFRVPRVVSSTSSLKTHPLVDREPAAFGNGTVSARGPSGLHGAPQVGLAARREVDDVLVAVRQDVAAPVDDDPRPEPAAHRRLTLLLLLDMTRRDAHDRREDARHYGRDSPPPLPMRPGVGGLRRRLPPPPHP